MSMPTTLRPILLGLAAGLLGMLLALALLHLYADHLLIDAARSNMTARPAATAAPSAPAARPPTPAPEPTEK